MVIPDGGEKRAASLVIALGAYKPVFTDSLHSYEGLGVANDP
jgi:hypothetical protein